jgi:hypothetical protein
MNIVQRSCAVFALSFGIIGLLFVVAWANDVREDRMHTVTANSLSPVFAGEWHFWRDGKQLAIRFGAQGSSGTFVLYDAASGKQVEREPSGLPQRGKTQLQLRDESIPSGLTQGEGEGEGALVGGGLETIKAGLARHKIALDFDSLVIALHNPDAEVRWLAAARLEDDKAVSAVEPIEKALSVESVLRARINIASSLTSLDPARGVPVLSNICKDQGTPDWAKLEVASKLTTYHNIDCISAVEDIATYTSETDTRRLALSILPTLSKLSVLDHRHIIEIESTFLEDKDPLVRMSASESLGLSGDRAAVPALQNRLQTETNEQVKDQIKQSLARLN